MHNFTITTATGKSGRNRSLMAGILPIDRSKISIDIVAGITLAALAIPEVMGYTKIAGMPVVTGLYTIHARHAAARSASSYYQARVYTTMRTCDIQIRDPFVYPGQKEGAYYLYGTTDRDCWRGPGQGFECYRSKDLREWDGPLPAFRPSSDFWGKENFWAPEVHKFNERFYMFASFKAERRYRGTQVLVAQEVFGPYEPLTYGPVTPADWQCLDGTLHVDQDGDPWIVFCHEWVQTHNGSIWAMRLTPDLKEAAGRPVFLFNASEASWVRKTGWPDPGSKYRFPTYVTDGPYLFRLGDGTLIMLWSSLGSQGYAMGVSRSDNGQVWGRWLHDPEPIWAEDGGHGMIFETFEGQLMLTFHSPNQSPEERAVFVEIEEKGGGIQLVGPGKANLKA